MNDNILSRQTESLMTILAKKKKEKRERDWESSLHHVASASERINGRSEKEEKKIHDSLIAIYNHLSSGHKQN